MPHDLISLVGEYSVLVRVWGQKLLVGMDPPPWCGEQRKCTHVSPALDNRGCSWSRRLLPGGRLPLCVCKETWKQALSINRARDKNSLCVYVCVLMCTEVPGNS